MKKFFTLLLFFYCGIIFPQEEKDTSELKGLRFVHLQVSMFSADYNRTMLRLVPEAKFDFTYEDKANFYFSFRNATWYDDAFSNYSNKQNIFNQAFSSSQKKYLNIETGLAWNVYRKNGYGAIRAGVVNTTYLLPLYNGTGKNFVAAYSLKQGINSALPDTLWTQNMSRPGNITGNIYGISTTVNSTDLFVGAQFRTGYDPKDKWFDDGDPRFSEYYIDFFYNASTVADNLVFAATKFTPALVKLNKFGGRIGWSRQTHLLFGFYFGAEAGIRPGYNYYNAEAFSSNGKLNTSFLNSASFVLKVGFKLGLPTKTVKRYL